MARGGVDRFDELIETCQVHVTWMRQHAHALHECGLEDMATAVMEQALTIETKASWALATPADESRPGGGWVDEMIDQLKMPWFSPVRPHIIWVLHWARRARSVVRHMAGVAEAYNEPATKVAAAQRLLDEIDEGPPPAVRDKIP